MGTVIVFIAIFLAIFLVIWGLLRLFFNLDIVTLFFLPDIINGFFWLISLTFQIIGLFFTRSGIAVVFFVLIVVGLIIDALK